MLKLYTRIGTRLCTGCARKVDLLCARFLEREVMIAVCPRCDGLTPKPWVPKEKP